MNQSHVAWTRFEIACGVTLSNRASFLLLHDTSLRNVFILACHHRSVSLRGKNQRPRSD